jgi:hypothetical protein
MTIDGTFRNYPGRAGLIGRAMGRSEGFRHANCWSVRGDLTHHWNRPAIATHATAVRAGGRSASPMPQAGGVEDSL